MPLLKEGPGNLASGMVLTGTPPIASPRKRESARLLNPSEGLPPAEVLFIMRPCLRTHYSIPFVRGDFSRMKNPKKTSRKEKGLAFVLRAFQYRNYRLFFGGQIVSLVGTWITNTAISWLVYRLTGSALLLGVVGFAAQLPAFILSPFAGIVADRSSRYRLLLTTQSLSMAQSFLLAALTLSGHITIPWLLVLCTFQGLINAFDLPARQAFVVELIENKKDFGNVIALNSSMFNVARLLGPAIGGVIIAAVGEGWCFLIDGVSFAAVIGAFLAMKIKPAASLKPKGSSLSQFKEGLKYAGESKPIRSLIGLVALVSLVGMPYMVLIPIFAGAILGGGPHTLGFLMAASGGGALIGALWLAVRNSVAGLEKVIPKATLLLGRADGFFRVEVSLAVACSDDYYRFRIHGSDGRL